MLKDYLGFQGSYNASAKILTLKKQQQNKVNISSETISDSNNNATIDIRYPQVSGLVNKEAQEAMNKTFKDKAEAFAAEAKKKQTIGMLNMNVLMNFMVPSSSPLTVRACSAYPLTCMNMLVVLME